jgi:hypothetical protein
MLRAKAVAIIGKTATLLLLISCFGIAALAAARWSGVRVASARAMGTAIAMEIVEFRDRGGDGDGHAAMRDRQQV